MRPDWLEEIRRDNTSGAAALAAKAARALAEWSAAGRSPEELGAVARELVRAQPRMAPLVNLASRLLEAGEGAPGACRAFLHRLETATEAAAQHGALLVPDGGAVLTHSFSSTVLRALRRAAGEGRRFSVIATESRPMREGVALARRLAGAGIPVRLVVDAAAGLFLGEVSLILVGADAVISEGVVNKTGTRALALAARERGLPVYALAGGDKFLPAGYHFPPEEPRDPREVLAEAVPGVTPVNYYFELTPLESFTGLVTEQGVLAPDGVRQRLAAAELHPSLRQG